MEVVYKCEVLFYCFQNQQTEEKIIKEQNCFSRISVDFNFNDFNYNVFRPEKRIKSRHLIHSFSLQKLLLDPSLFPIFSTLS